MVRRAARGVNCFGRLWKTAVRPGGQAARSLLRVPVPHRRGPCGAPDSGTHRMRAGIGDARRVKAGPAAKHSVPIPGRGNRGGAVPVGRA
ncbi:hypothetical protein GCM10018787_17080 [Streptomyces thermodiastaticus]|nr:hypothetical protein GCM10018787_17080 [Streptomyces thermodiastaticus]